jgi:metallophosphoesterase (TIGR00282 family)
VRVLMVGDVIGKPGRRVLGQVLPELKRQERLDFVVVNGENAAGGFGLTEETADEIFNAGADVITSGNHIWDQRDIIPSLEGELPILRPANYPHGSPGRGVLRIGRTAVINLQGRVFMPEGLDSPFDAVDDILALLEKDLPKVILVDVHAETTSEKGALGWYLDGRVTAVVGTHTHVPTADAKLLPGGTAFVSDLGMTGPLDSIIGSKVEDVLGRFLTAMPRRLAVADGDLVQFNSVLIEVNDLTGKASSIQRMDQVVQR